MNPTENRMQVDRCAYLMAVAIANKLNEAWMSNQPELSYVYFNQYMPTFAKWWACFPVCSIPLKLKSFTWQVWITWKLVQTSLILRFAYAQILVIFVISLRVIVKSYPRLGKNGLSLRGRGRPHSVIATLKIMLCFLIDSICPDMYPHLPPSDWTILSCQTVETQPLKHGENNCCI